VALALRRRLPGRQLQGAAVVVVQGPCKVLVQALAGLAVVVAVGRLLTARLGLQISAAAAVVLLTLLLGPLTAALVVLALSLLRSQTPALQHSRVELRRASRQPSADLRFTP
jgi:hypothetical protein